jgi:nitrite reductase/ring-hydroxylating ferredoxin subunit
MTLWPGRPRPGFRFDDTRLGLAEQASNRYKQWLEADSGELKVMWQKIASKSDLPGNDEAKEFTLGEKTVCVAKIDGVYSAMDNVCVHRGGPLGQGVILDGKIVCPWHGWMYDPKTGAADVNPSARVSVYPIKVDGEDVLIEM